MNETVTATVPWNLTDVNTTTSTLDPAVPEPVAFKVTKIFVYGLIFVVSMAGNCAVIGIILRSTIMRSVPGNLLILNLALCDFLTPFISIPFDLAVEEAGTWIYGAAMCRILWPSATLTTTSSSLTLAVIAFERYRSLMHPFHSKLTITQVKRAIVGIHASSLLVVLPYVLVLDLTEDQQQCDEMHWPEHASIELRQSYTTTLFIVQYIGPLFFMAYMYGQTCKSLFQSTERVRASSMSSVESLGSTTDVRPRSGSFSNRPFRRPELPLARKIFRDIEQERNIRVTKMFILVVIIFAVCMLPNQVVWLWADFGDNFQDENFPVVSIACRFFTYTNSCLNPCIFFKFSREFRQGLRRMFPMGSCCVRGRTHVREAYKSWRASRTATSISVSAVPGVKSGQTLTSTLPLESTWSSSSVFEREDGEASATFPTRNKDRPRRGIHSLARGLLKGKLDHVKAVSCSLLHASKAGKCDEDPLKAEAEKLHSTEESRKIEINLEDLLSLPSLGETSC